MRFFELAASTHDQEVFSFYPDETFCNGFEEVLRRYRELVPNLRLAGYNSFHFFLFFILLSVLCLTYFLDIFLSLYTYLHLFSLTGPTSFAPVIEMAITIVEQNGGQYHVLLIIADGQVTCLLCVVQ